MVELLGNEALVHARLGELILVAKAESPRAPKMRARVALDVELDALHLFDAESEQRLEP